MIKTLYFWIVFCFWTILCFLLIFIVYIPSLIFDPQRKLIHYIGHFWGKLTIYSMPFWKFDFKGLENIPKGSQIVIANHKSALDMLIIFSLPIDIRWMAKDSLKYVPFIGWALWLGNNIFVKRDNPESKKKAMEKAKHLVEQGCSLIFFPEGTRVPGPALGVFKLGAFKIVNEYQVPLTPVTISGANNVWPKGSFKIYSGTVKVTIAPSIIPSIPADEKTKTIDHDQELMLKCRKIIESALLLCVLLLTNCATYTGEMTKFREAFYDENTEALSLLEKSPVASRSQDKVLYHLERGMLEYVSKDFKEATNNFSAAETLIDQLYTTSLSKEAGGLAIGEYLTDFKGETHEQLLTLLFSAQSYLSLKKPSAALVDIRRLQEKISTLKIETPMPYVHYLSGLIYEMNKNWDDAIISYKKAWDDKLIESSIPLKRLALLRNRKDILNLLPKTTPKSEETEVVFVLENGRSPIKVPENIFVPLNDTVVRVSFPVYRDVYYGSRYASIALNEKFLGNTENILDINSLCKQSLEKRRSKDLMRAALRVFTKDQAARRLGQSFGIFALILTNIFSVATETADTRSWTTLPDSLQLYRFSLNPNTSYDLRIKPQQGPAHNVRLRLAPGEKKFIQIRTFS